MGAPKAADAVQATIIDEHPFRHHSKTRCWLGDIISAPVHDDGSPLHLGEMQVPLLLFWLFPGVG
jgi:hypothetical protein